VVKLYMKIIKTIFFENFIVFQLIEKILLKN